MTVEEALKQSGFSDDQIKALDPKAITAFSGMLTTAEKDRLDAAAARDAAELAQRSNVEFYETKIAPALTGWEEEKQRKENDVARANAELAFYRTQAEEAKKSGFIPGDAPGFDPAKFVPPNPGVAQARDPQGRYIAGAPGTTPGSPTFFDVNKVYEKAGDAVGILADIQWEHQRLFNQPLPLSPTELIRQADAVKLDPKTYAARTYNWDARRQQMKEEDERKRAEEIATKAVAPYEQKFKEQEAQFKKDLAERERQWAERVGSNPDVRASRPSQYTDLQRGIKAGDLPDPLALNDQQRRQLTSTMIRKDMAEGQVA